MKRAIQRAVLAACVLAPVLVVSLSLDAKKKPDPIADLSAAIRSEVADAERATRLLASADEMAGLIQEIGALAREQRESLGPMLREHGTERKDVEAKLADLGARRAALARKVLELHVAFKAETTPEEWKKLRKAEEQALRDAAATSLGEGSVETTR